MCAHRRCGKRVLAGAALAAATVACPGAARADRVVVLPAAVRDLPPEIIRAARADLVHRIAAGDTVVDLDQPPIDDATEWSRALALGAENAADWVVELRAAREPSGTAADVEMVVYWIAGGGKRAVVRDRAPGPDEMPAVIDRMDRALARLRPGSRPPGFRGDIRGSVAMAGDRVSDRAAGRPVRYPHTDLGLRVGVLVPVHDPAREVMSVPLLGVSVVRHDRPILVEILGEYGYDGQVGSLGLGVYWAGIERGDGAAYAGGSFRWASVQLGGLGASGWAVEPAIGFLWATSRNTHLRAELGYYVQGFEEREPDRLIEGWGVGRVSNGPSVTAGFLF